MKHLPFAVVIFFVLLFAFTKWVGPIPFSVTSFVTTKTDTFTVTGEGKATAIPDIAVVTAGVQAQGGSVVTIQNELNAKMNRITDAIKQLGVEAKDIQTSNYSISPTYDYTNGTPRITGYEASSTLTIKIRALDRINGVIDAATANGATNVGNISFDVSNRTTAENEARNSAIKQAQMKAQTAARSAGFTLGRVINYSEGTAGQVRPYPVYEDLNSAPGATTVPKTQIEPGSSEITIDVSLSYEIR